MNCWWLSFADASLPEGSQFLGAGWFIGERFMDAVFTTRLLNQNPGGEIRGAGPVPVDALNEQWRKLINTLQSKEQIEQFTGESLQPWPDNFDDIEVDG